MNIPVPAAPGEYYFGLIVADQEGLRDTVPVLVHGHARTDGGNDDDRIEPCMGTGRAHLLHLSQSCIAGRHHRGRGARLARVRDLGFKVVWLMPVMKNAYPIDMGSGPGYNITDFYNVAAEYGTNQDFKDFVQEAHPLASKSSWISLRITTSRSHPWAVDARAFGQDSRYWTWYEHTLIPHNTNGLDQTLDAYGFTYYSGSATSC